MTRERREAVAVLLIVLLLGVSLVQAGIALGQRECHGGRR